VPRGEGEGEVEGAGSSWEEGGNCSCIQRGLSFPFFVFVVIF